MKKEGWDKKQILAGAKCCLTGMLLIVASRFFGGTNVRDFISGVLIGVGCGITLVGVYGVAKTFREKK